MRLLPNEILVAVVCCLIGLLSSRPAAASDDSDGRASTSSVKQDNPKWSAMFDLGSYAKRFHKRYESPIEATARQVYLTSSSFKVYAAAVAYRSRERNSFQAINKFSDMSRQELERLLGRQHGKRSDKPIELDASQEIHRLDEDLRGKLGKDLSIKEEQKNSSRRKKREAVEPRPLPLKDLIESGQQEPESEATLAKLDRNPISNNPNFDPRNNLPGSGSRIRKADNVDEIIVHWLEHWPQNNQDEGLLAKLGRLSRQLTSKLARLCGRFSKSAEYEKSQDEAATLPDEMFVDLRNSGCMFKPRDQGECGSCYIFAGMALIEYLYCKASGRLVQFSEQYMLDCGPGRIDLLRGCNGGVDWAVAEFVHNYGVLLGEDYGYKARESTCPFTNETDIATTGYIRMDMEHVSWVPMRVWPQIVQISPIMVGVSLTLDDFYPYGGGVYQVASNFEFDKATNHQMVLVGHGREDGREFWLLRNSFGTDWGDSGYYKLDKEFAERCIEKVSEESGGFLYATNDALNYEVEPILNEAFSGTRADSLSREGSM